jgi:uncharacterized membrane protein YkoI
MPVKLFASAVIAALLLTGTAFSVSHTPGQGVQIIKSRETGADTALTADEALAIALNHAGLTESRIRRLERELDREKGRSEWDIEFICDGFEYSYEIHAETGAILDWDQDRDD